MLRKVIRHTPRKGKILEVGLGSGWSSIGLAQMGYYLVGIDRSKDVLEYARYQQRRFCVFFDLVLADACKLPFRANCFDTLFSQGLLEHFDEETILMSLKEQRFVSRIVIIDVPSEKSKNDPGLFGDENLWSWRKWEKLIRTAGLEVINKYGNSPTKIAYIFPMGMWKLMSYRFSKLIGFVTVKKNKPSPVLSRIIENIKESLAD